MTSRIHPRGFSYVEMLVVLLLGSILCAAATGPLRSYLAGKKRAECAENLRKLHLVMSLYANDHGDQFPAAGGARDADSVLRGLVPQYTSDAGIFRCPVSGEAVGYAYVAGLARADVAPLLADRADGHAKAAGNVIFTDGHEETFAPGARRLSPLPPGALVLEPKP